jgi:type IV pilus assembly protein PilE
MSKFQGITLFELLITISIIAILTTISVSIYTQHFIHENRIEAAIALEKLAANLEQYNTLHNSYTDATLSGLNITAQAAKKSYQLAIVNATDTDFIITATPSEEQAQKDPNCLTLSLNNKGEKGITGAGQVNDCW